jgi:hypothetical protein
MIEWWLNNYLRTIVNMQAKLHNYLRMPLLETTAGVARDIAKKTGR